MHEHTAQLFSLARAIAEALGFGWTVIRPPEDELQRWVDLQHDDDPSCGLRLSRVWNDEGRLRLAGRYPSHAGYNGLAYRESPAEITVSAERSPQQTARDVKRCLLPTYMEQYPRAAAAVADSIAHSAATAETDAQACALVWAYDLRVRGRERSTSVHVEYAHGTEVTLKLYSVPRERLQALLDLLGEGQG
jgi:hypothetical protein